MQPWAGGVCTQQPPCSDCAALSIALMLSIVTQRSTAPLHLGTHCARMSTVQEAANAFRRVGACAGDHCSVLRLSPPLCTPAPPLVVRANVGAGWLRARVRGARAAAATTFATDYPRCDPALPTAHMVAVVGARAGFFLVQNSYGTGWGANGLAAVRYSRARACRLLQAVVVVAGT